MNKQFPTDGIRKVALMNPCFLFRKKETVNDEQVGI